MRASIGGNASRNAPMRPPILNPLFAALTMLPGVGPKLEKLYRRLFGRVRKFECDVRSGAGVVHDLDVGAPAFGLRSNHVADDRHDRRGHARGILRERNNRHGEGQQNNDERSQPHLDV